MKLTLIIVGRGSNVFADLDLGGTSVDPNVDTT